MKLKLLILIRNPFFPKPFVFQNLALILEMEITLNFWQEKHSLREQ
jgi:hypothetical protein